MNIEIKKAPPGSAKLLAELDRQIFSAEDAFSEEDWLGSGLEAYLLYIDGQIAGSAALQPRTDIRSRKSYPPAPDCLYIVSTGVLAEFRGKGLGLILKTWEVAYAKTHGYARMVTNMRESNAASIALNEKFSFYVREIIPNYYPDGESAFVMELNL